MNCATAPVPKAEKNTSNPPQVVTKSDTMDIDTGLGILASQIAKSMQEEKKTRIAILDFTDLQGNVSDLGRFISEKLIIKLFETKKFNIIERNKLNKILEEQKFQVSDLVDEESAKRIGKIIGVDAIVIGTVTDLGEQIDINARLLSIETGSVFAVASARVQKD